MRRTVVGGMTASPPPPPPPAVEMRLHPLDTSSTTNRSRQRITFCCCVARYIQTHDWMWCLPMMENQPKENVLVHPLVSAESGWGFKIDPTSTALTGGGLVALPTALHISNRTLNLRRKSDDLRRSLQPSTNAKFLHGFPSMRDVTFYPFGVKLGIRRRHVPLELCSALVLSSETGASHSSSG